jgi:CRP-like cAMP-binding protein
MSSKAPAGNQLLTALTSSDIELLRPDLEPRTFDVRHSIEEPNRTIHHVYFLDAGVASVVALTADHDDREVEIGVIGREGVTGGAVIMGNDRSPHRTYMQIAGAGHRITAPKFRRAMDRSASLRGIFLKSVQAFNVQTAHTAIANARANLEQRLARWLLMAHDRVDGDDLPLTHEFLSLMLAVRRSGVTEALQSFEKQKLITHARKRISVLNRKGIEKIANGFYGVPESELRRLMSEGRASRPR